MTVHQMTRPPMASLADQELSAAAPETSPDRSSYAPPSPAAAARVRTAPHGAREEAFGHLLTRLDETTRFTAAAESEATEELLEAVQGEAAAPDRHQIATWAPSLEAILRTLCENSGRIIRRHGPDAEAAVLHGLKLLSEVPRHAPDLGRLRRLAHAVSTILDLAGDAP